MKIFHAIRKGILNLWDSTDFLVKILAGIVFYIFSGTSIVLFIYLLIR